MSVVTLPSDARPQPVSGAAEVVFARKDGATRLAHLYQHDPLRVLFPRPEDAAQPVAVLATTSGGLVGGDRLAIAATVGAGASGLFTTQAAEKVYRSAGPDCRVEIALAVGRDGWMEWLPHESILFEGARLRRRTVVDVAPGGRLMAAEAIVLGRTARGERMTRGLARDAWEIRRDGRLAWADALHLEGDLARLIAAPACLDGAIALATFVHVADDAAEHLDLARALLPANDDEELRSAATVVNGVLVARWLARDASTMRASLSAFWAFFRRRAGGRVDGVPRIWSM
ncbi:MAG: urease accessory protein UreD [Alphaproteobacteria bacterium]|nr:urease accessory protein UreD [Alphaproteobacteria bacterium]